MLSQMKQSFRRAFSLIPILLTHELGHVAMANFYGFPVLRWTFTYSEIVFIPVPTAVQETLVFLGGFIFTFCPALFVYAYLLKKGSRNWDLPFLWICAAPALASQDFTHLGSMFPQLGLSLPAVAVGSTVIMFIWFVRGEMRAALSSRARTMEFNDVE